MLTYVALSKFRGKTEIITKVVIVNEMLKSKVTYEGKIFLPAQSQGVKPGPLHLATISELMASAAFVIMFVEDL